MLVNSDPNLLFIPWGSFSKPSFPVGSESQLLKVTRSSKRKQLMNDRRSILDESYPSEVLAEQVSYTTECLKCHH